MTKFDTIFAVAVLMLGLFFATAINQCTALDAREYRSGAPGAPPQVQVDPSK